MEWKIVAAVAVAAAVVIAAVAVVGTMLVAVVSLAVQLAAPVAVVVLELERLVVAVAQIVPPVVEFAVGRLVAAPVDAQLALLADSVMILIKRSFNKIVKRLICH